jgi:hypothetical protein
MEKTGVSRTLRLALAGAGLLLVAACASVSEPPMAEGPPIVDRTGEVPTGDAEAPQCAAEAYQVLVGQPIGEIDTDSLPIPLRIYGPDQMITMDYRPDRMNIVLDADDIVVEVRCG